MTHTRRFILINEGTIATSQTHKHRQIADGVSVFSADQYLIDDRAFVYFSPPELYYKYLKCLIPELIYNVVTVFRQCSSGAVDDLTRSKATFAERKSFQK